MNNFVKLKFNKALTYLTGYDFGSQTFEDQVRGKINAEEKFVIEFPEPIIDVGSSFVQGFVSVLIKEIGRSGLKKNLQVKAHSPRLEKSIIDKID